MHEDALHPGRSYLVKAGSTTAPARVGELKFKVNVNTLEQEPGSTLGLNEVGVCTFNTDAPISFDSYRENRATGSFIIIDRLTNATVGAGMLHQPLLQSERSHWASLTVDRASRAAIKGQKPRIAWFGAAKGTDTTAISALAEKKLHSLGRHTFLITEETLPPQPDGAGSGETLRRVADLAAACADAGLVVLVALPDSDPGAARELLNTELLIEIAVEPESTNVEESAEKIALQLHSDLQAE